MPRKGNPKFKKCAIECQKKAKGLKFEQRGKVVGPCVRVCMAKGVSAVAGLSAASLRKRASKKRTTKKRTVRRTRR